MKKIEAIIKPFKLDEVKEALQGVGLQGMTEKTTDALLKKMKDEDIKFLDLRFTDPKGKMQHVTFHSDLVDEDLFKDGTMFDGSSISGWKDINESGSPMQLQRRWTRSISKTQWLFSVTS